jgi:L-ascorbate metabolism protein UlaG (beta-lactamase superfamily)
MLETLGFLETCSLIGEIYKPDVALIPIGGYYTMGAREAAEAVNMLKPKAVIPMHYKLFQFWRSQQTSL